MCRGCAAEFLDQVHVFLPGCFLRGALEFGPSFIFCGADKVKEPRFGPADITFGTLLVQRVQAQQGVVIRALGQCMHILGGLFEQGLQIGHVGSPCTEICVDAAI